MPGTLVRPAVDVVVAPPPDRDTAGSTLLTRPSVVAGADVLSATDTLAQALALGVLRADDVLAGRAWVRDASGSHRVHVVGTGGEASAVVKTPGTVSVLDGDDPVRAEREALRLLSGSGLTPELLGGAGETSPGQLWTVAVDGEVLATRGGAAASGEPFTAWGTTLAALHRHPVRGGEPVAPLPWLLAHPHVAPGHLGGRAAPAAVREVLTQALGRPVLAEALRSLARSWRRTGWIHGDASPANAITTSGSPRIGHDLRSGVVLIDLEHAGLGDPDWDLATAVDGIDVVTPDPDRAGAHREQLLAGYWAAGGPGRLDPRHLSVRVLMAAVRHAGADSEQGWDTPAGPRALGALNRAEALASAPRDSVPAAGRSGLGSGETP